MTPNKRIGALIIGQSPRPDLVGPLRHMLPDFQLVQAGALDHLTIDDLPEVDVGHYPLATRLRTGHLVKVEEQFLGPHLQRALDGLEQQEVAATLLLCAGTFDALKGRRPLFKPFNIAAAALRTSGLQQIGVVCPFRKQQPAIAQRWAAAGFQATVWTAALGENSKDLAGIQHQANRCEALVLDYVGHPVEDVLHLQQMVDIPVIDLGYLAASVMATTLWT